MGQKAEQIVVIGAGIGGLAAALRLAVAGENVLVLERHAAVGGKMRTVPSEVGPVDAGPTVMTMRHVFDDLLENAGTTLESTVDLIQHDILARHAWSDGSALDLYYDTAKSAAAVESFAGKREADAFLRFSERTKILFDAFDEPMMQAASPRQMDLTLKVMSQPHVIPKMDPLRSLAASLSNTFGDPRLRQLFGRYATYVGGSPYASPALLSLIWSAEQAGVWSLKGGMHTLAAALAGLIEKAGGTITLNQGVARIQTDGHGVTGVITDDGSHILTEKVVFNGDPRALSHGMLGQNVGGAVSKSHVEPRSLSAFVWSFAAKPRGANLVHHNLFFADNPETEFGDLAQGQVPSDATLYVCAQDRNDSAQPTGGAERFEIIMNGPPAQSATYQEEAAQCQTQTFERLSRMGLTFETTPTLKSLTTPTDFADLFPGSAGALYGRSPHGLLAAMKRPRAQTKIPGLYLAGGGAHPGAGIPMAALSGKHAAEAILADRTSASRSRRTAMHGGTSTGSAQMAHGPSQSSAS
ncbi:1-hydroxycarotenoid 3,4-desaturase CrtD [Litoreibacter roseus]|uniref:Hydroxyneurosporene desaturase n=1 Tax=Litoreibacter roseus TaxID=2601869 RepID=A0A6N6JH44_9RHOB|nr:1-hydroxycarotenoid 3,4-desaturase CrtD [Litoreibacter roseus]GFE64608.1 hydroxyneurosporene desaturase [Litoreibacter roseus]